jgi:hypothetical protein
MTSVYAVGAGCATDAHKMVPRRGTERAVVVSPWWQAMSPLVG